MSFHGAYRHVQLHMLALTGQFGPLDLRHVHYEPLFACYLCDTKAMCLGVLGVHKTALGFDGSMSWMRSHCECVCSAETTQLSHTCSWTEGMWPVASAGITFQERRKRKYDGQLLCPQAFSVLVCKTYACPWCKVAALFLPVGLCLLCKLSHRHERLTPVVGITYKLVEICRMLHCLTCPHVPLICQCLKAGRCSSLKSTGKLWFGNLLSAQPNVPSPTCSRGFARWDFHLIGGGTGMCVVGLVAVLQTSRMTLLTTGPMLNGCVCLQGLLLCKKTRTKLPVGCCLASFITSFLPWWSSRMRNIGFVTPGMWLKLSSIIDSCMRTSCHLTCAGFVLIPAGSNGGSHTCT